MIDIASPTVAWMTMKWLAAGLMALLRLTASEAQAQSQPSAKLTGENLLMVPPLGFKDSRDGVSLMEWVPTNETVENWSEMVTAQVFARRPDLEPTAFLGAIQKQWLAACKGSTSAPIITDKVNGYAAAMMLLPSAGKPETTMLRAIKGTDALYVVQRATRSAGSPQEMDRLKKFFDGVGVCVCDVRSREQPCPDLQPHR
jgi:hypothetical protein